MNNSSRILFVCRNFDSMAGGIERMSTNIMNHLVEQGFNVSLVTWDVSSAKSRYKLHPSIDWYKLDLGSPFTSASWLQRFKRQLSLRQIASQIKPTHVIGFQFGTFLAIRTALLLYPAIFIAAERNSPQLFCFTKSQFFNRLLWIFSLSLADVITIQFSAYSKYYPFYLKNKLRVISNPVSLPRAINIDSNQSSKSINRILNVGRLSYQKNQIFLLKAFSKIAAVYPDWVLTLVGEGESRSSLELLITRYNLSDQVELVGSVKDVDYWYERSSIFAFPSLWEGFPNALTEAMSHSLPVVGFSCTDGVNELIIDNYNGLLSSSSVTEFSYCIQELILSPQKRTLMGLNARESIKKYAPVSIYRSWEKVFSHL